MYSNARVAYSIIIDYSKCTYRRNMFRLIVIFMRELDSKSKQKTEPGSPRRENPTNLYFITPIFIYIRVYVIGNPRINLMLRVSRFSDCRRRDYDNIIQAAVHLCVSYRGAICETYDLTRRETIAADTFVYFEENTKHDTLYISIISSVVLYRYVE